MVGLLLATVSWPRLKSASRAARPLNVRVGTATLTAVRFTSRIGTSEWERSVCRPGLGHGSGSRTCPGGLAQSQRFSSLVLRHVSTPAVSRASCSGGVPFAQRIDLAFELTTPFAVSTSMLRPSRHHRLRHACADFIVIAPSGPTPMAARAAVRADSGCSGAALIAAGAVLMPAPGALGRCAARSVVIALIHACARRAPARGCDARQRRYPGVTDVL